MFVSSYAEPAIDVRQVLASRVPDDEAQELASATVLTPMRRTLITLLALGDSHAKAAAALGVGPGNVHNWVVALGRALHCPSRQPAIVNAAYRDASFPLPRRDDRPVPDLDPDEWRLLLAYGRGRFLREISTEERLSLLVLRQVDRRLTEKVGASCRGNIVRRAWQLGRLARVPDYSAAPSLPRR